MGVVMDGWRSPQPVLGVFLMYGQVRAPLTFIFGITYAFFGRSWPDWVLWIGVVTLFLDFCGMNGVFDPKKKHSTPTNDPRIWAEIKAARRARRKAKKNAQLELPL